MRETIATPSTNPGSIGKFPDEMLRNRLTWGIVPDEEMTAAGMHVIHIVPSNGTTITHVNPLDPATAQDNRGPAWFMRPSAYGPVIKAGSR